VDKRKRSMRRGGTLRCGQLSSHQNRRGSFHRRPGQARGTLGETRSTTGVALRWPHVAGKSHPFGRTRHPPFPFGRLRKRSALDPAGVTEMRSCRRTTIIRADAHPPRKVVELVARKSPPARRGCVPAPKGKRDDSFIWRLGDGNESRPRTDAEWLVVVVRRCVIEKAAILPNVSKM